MFTSTEHFSGRDVQRHCIVKEVKRLKAHEMCTHAQLALSESVISAGTDCPGEREGGGGGGGGGAFRVCHSWSLPEPFIHKHREAL